MSLARRIAPPPPHPGVAAEHGHWACRGTARGRRPQGRAPPSRRIHRRDDLSTATPAAEAAAANCASAVDDGTRFNVRQHRVHAAGDGPLCQRKADAGSATGDDSHAPSESSEIRVRVARHIAVRHLPHPPHVRKRQTTRSLRDPHRMFHMQSRQSTLRALRSAMEGGTPSLRRGPRQALS